MQKLLEKTKSKLANVESECAKLKSNNDMLKNAVERANKAKEALEKKAYKNAPPTGMSKTAGLNEQELRDQNAQLHNEVRLVVCVRARGYNYQHDRSSCFFRFYWFENTPQFKLTPFSLNNLVRNQVANMLFLTLN